MGCYDQAIVDLGKAIQIDPLNPLSYHQRAMAHFHAGNYESSSKDFQQFVTQTPKEYSFSATEFSAGFARGLPKGMYESGEGMVRFLSDLTLHPIRTANQMKDAMVVLIDLVRNDEWGVIAQALSPEVYQLVQQWDSLPSDKRGELAGYALGKHGADILAPGALVKVARKSVKTAQELSSVCKTMKIVEESLILEAAAEIGSSQIAKAIQTGQRTTYFAEELGFTFNQTKQLNQAGVLEVKLLERYNHLTVSNQQSLQLHTLAKEALKPYAKKPMPEFRVREIIHENGFPTFPRPKGIPDNYLVMVSDKGAGVEYVHPTNDHIRVRVMPGKKQSPFPYQQNPYVVQKTDQGYFGKSNTIFDRVDPEAHIPLEEFVYRN